MRIEHKNKNAESIFVAVKSKESKPLEVASNSIAFEHTREETKESKEKACVVVPQKVAIGLDRACRNARWRHSRIRCAQ